MWFSKQDHVIVDAKENINQMIDLLTETKKRCERSKYTNANSNPIIIGKESTIMNDLTIECDHLINSLKKKETVEKFDNLFKELKIHKTSIYLKEIMGRIFFVISALSRDRIFTTRYELKVWAFSECICITKEAALSYIFGL